MMGGYACMVIAVMQCSFYCDLVSLYFCVIVFNGSFPTCDTLIVLSFICHSVVEVLSTS